MANNKKISAFTQETAFLQTDLVNIVRNSTNYTVPFSAYATALGVTGTINVVGGAGAPVLEQPSGTVNNIRTLESGAGIIAAVSAQNGIEIKNNFSQDTNFIRLVDDLTIASPLFPSFAAGSGMQITKALGVMTFTATGALPATKAVTVNSMSDFPAAVTGVITLEANTTYIVSNVLTTSDRFVLSNETCVTGQTILGPILTYTGSATMFTGVDVNAQFLNLQIDCPSAQIFDFSSTTSTHLVGINNVRCISHTTAGTFTSLFSLVISNFVSQLAATDGFIVAGTGIFLASFKDIAFVSLNAGFVAIDFGVATANNIDINNLVCSAPAGAIGIKGAASNANLISGGFGEISNCNFISDVTPISGIVISDDVQWEASNNEGIENTRPDSLSINTAGTTVTIAIKNTPVIIAGTWIDDNSSHFTVNLAGRVTYNGVKNFHCPIDGLVTCEPASGTNKDFTIYVAINGSIVANSGTLGRASAGDRVAIPITWQYEFTPGDYVELWLENNTGTTNFTVSRASLRVN